jgi:uncharacterized protein (DUF433 family)
MDSEDSRIKYFVDSEEEVFSLLEESDVFRMRVCKSEVEEPHVQEFIDKTVEWFSTSPTKGILIDLEGVKSVCPGFTVALTRYYEKVKSRGLFVRFVNVDPRIKPYVEVSNITVVMAIAKKTVISARAILRDLTENLSDEELMKKHKLSAKGLKSLYQQLLGKRLVGRQALARRIEGQAKDPSLVFEIKGAKEVTLKASDVLNSIDNGMTDAELMREYRLTPRGLQSLFRKLYDNGLISRATFKRRKDSSEKMSPSD